MRKWHVHLCTDASEKLPCEDSKAELPGHVVVFVHGMGRALKGGTLQEWAQPLAQSLCDRSLDIAPSNQYAPLIIDKADAVGEAPEMSVRVLQGIHPDGKPDYLTVLMTEASWGSDFAPANGKDTLLWVASMADIVGRRSLELLWWNLYPGYPGTAKNFWQTLSSIGKRFLQYFLCSLALIVGLLLLPIVLLILFVVVFLAVLPGVGRWVKGFVALFADFLGDPQVWKRRPLQAAAMRQRIRDTLRRWDSATDVPITVVAHSQGAAVAGQVLLQGSNRSRVNNFVTVGSGLSLLGYAQWGGPGEDPVRDWLGHPNIRWINVWGKFDFVPFGPISTFENGANPVFRKIYDRNNPTDPGPGPEEHPVYNRSALILDHVVYSRNRVEVIDPIAGLILPRRGIADDADAVSTIWFKGTDNDPRMGPHRVLVKSLGVTRLLSVFAGLLAAPAILSLLESIPWVRPALVRLEMIPSLPGTIVQCSVGTEDQGQWWFGWICSGSMFQWASINDWVVLTASTIVIAGVLLAFLNGTVWNFFHGRVERLRKKPQKALKKQPGDSRPNGPGKPSGDPWPHVTWYFFFSYILSVALPLNLLIMIWDSRLLSSLDVLSAWYAIGAVGLYMQCLFGIKVTPLEARRYEAPLSAGSR